jgi:hypothetical protein
MVRKILCIAAALALMVLLGSSARVQAVPEPEPIVTIYDHAVMGTIVPASLLRAIAIVESGECDAAVGDGGQSLGRFQLYEKYHASRAADWGEYDPRDPMQAGYIAARYLEACLLAFPGDMVRAVCAYRQGIHGVKRDGPTAWYYERVMGAI